jgi:surface antigen
MLKKILLAATLTLTSGLAVAQPRWVPPGNDPDGYYSDADRGGYYTRDGRYRRIREPRRDYGPPPPPPPVYYQQGHYEENCRRGNTTAGTIFGALGGAAIGAGVSRGDGGAAVGGAILGGILGNVIARDIDCEDQPTAFRVYADGLNGPIGRPHEWRNRGNRGTFTATREFRRGGMVCREFTETTYRRGQSFSRSGTACREMNGHWRFD